MAKDQAHVPPGTNPPKTAGLADTLKLKATRAHWEKLARADARWAVLTDNDKKGGQWKTDEFYATGQADVAASLAWIRSQGIEPGRGEALDFGCGVGRLTQALAQHFERVTGVDVSAEMVAQARAHNPRGETVQYVHNPESNLSCFATGRFVWVYSLITLQHIPPAISRLYIAEFCRVTAPGGLILFQMTASRPKRRFSYYPPTHLRRLLQWLGLIPRMQMHAIPRAEVEAILQAAGAEIVSVKPHENGAIESYYYLARKR